MGFCSKTKLKQARIKERMLKPLCYVLDNKFQKHALEKCPVLQAKDIYKSLRILKKLVNCLTETNWN